MIFKSRNVNVDHNLINININNTEIKRVNNMTFLSVVIDENFTWKEHIHCISLKISKSIGILDSLKYILPLNILVNLYNSMILSHLTYCKVVWGNCASCL